MKALTLVLIASLCIFGVCFAAGNFLIDDLQGTVSGGPDGTVDYGAGNGSEVKVSADTDIIDLGTESLKIEYKAVAGGYMWIARGWDLDAKRAVWLVRPQDISWNKYKAISFYMYGSNSGTRIAFDVKDNGNEMWRFIFKDDFTGWQQIICLFDGFFARGDWQPDNADKNAAIDFPIKSYQLEPLPESEGILYFDHVELIAKE